MSAKEATAERLGLCPRVEAAFALLSKKWTGLIVYTLMEGPKYFCELERAIPDLSARLLTLRLKELEAVDILKREVLDASPVRVRYELTGKGQALRPVLEGIEAWARQEEEADE